VATPHREPCEEQGMGLGAVPRAMPCHVERDCVKNRLLWHNAASKKTIKLVMEAEWAL
jgi:hypothetical protein